MGGFFPWRCYGKSKLCCCCCFLCKGECVELWSLCFFILPPFVAWRSSWRAGWRVSFCCCRRFLDATSKQVDVPGVLQERVLDLLWRVQSLKKTVQKRHTMVSEKYSESREPAKNKKTKARLLTRREARSQRSRRVMSVHGPYFEVRSNWRRIFSVSAKSSW